MPSENTKNARPAAKRKRRDAGIVVRHSRGCGSRSGGRCSCLPAYQAQVWAARERKPIRKTFHTVAEARAWRQESQVALRQGTLCAPTPTTLEQAADDWLQAAAAGVIRTRSGDRYKPSALRAYKQALRYRVLPAIGHQRLTAISANMLQDLADQLAASGLSASSIRNTILPLRAIYRRAHKRGEVALNPTLSLSLPAVRGTRDRIAAPAEASALLNALPLADRAICATALYAGLRLGELQALDWNQIGDARSRLSSDRRSLRTMEVLFEVTGSWFPLRERAATILAEDLRRKAAGQLGTEGTEGALATADAIEDVLVGRFDGPIPLEGEAAEAVYYDLDVAAGTSPADSEERALHAALRPLHEQHTREP